MVELALLVPVILLLLLGAIDFGRVYLGWINLNQMARLAANFASTNPDADFSSPTGQYQELVLQDARAINCDPLPEGPTDTIPEPVFASGTELGDLVTVSITCRFGIITPVISSVLSDVIDVSASSTFAIRTGAVDGIPTGGGGGTSNVPIAEFNASPTSGNAPLTVTFTDLSSNGPLTWQWNFGDGGSNLQNPSHTYNSPGTYSVSLTVENNAGLDTETKIAYVVVDAPPTGLAANFSGGPSLSGPAPLTVTFTDETTGGTPTSWDWDFGNGQTRTGEGPHTITYDSDGSYDVTLTVSDGTSTNTLTLGGYVNVAVALCDVPNVSDGLTRPQAISALTAAGFTNIVATPSQGNWRVRTQSPAGGFQDYPCGELVTITN